MSKKAKAAPAKKAKGAAKVERGSLTLESFKSKYASSVVDVRDLVVSSSFFTTGSLRLDSLLKGGFPSGTMVELWGPPQSGKSTVAIKAVSHILKAGGRVVYYDLERGLDLVNEAEWLEDYDDNGVLRSVTSLTEAEQQERDERRESWLRRNGIDVLNPNFVLMDPEDGEEMFTQLADIVMHNLADFVVVDSVAAIITRAEMAGLAGESHFGQVAKLLSVELKRLTRLYKGNPQTTIVFINQAREKISHMAKGKKSTGGHALEHYVGTKVEFTKIGRSEEDDDVVTESLVRVTKSRFSSARSARIYVSGKRGLDTLREVLEFAVDFRLVHQSGAWFYLFQDPVEDDTFKRAKDRTKIEGFLGRKQGEVAVLEWMRKEGWEERLTEYAKKSGGL